MKLIQQLYQNGLIDEQKQQELEAQVVATHTTEE